MAAHLEFIILHHSKEGGVLLAGRVDYAAQGWGETLLITEIFYFYVVMLREIELLN